MPTRWEISVPGINPESVAPKHLGAMVAYWFDEDTIAHRAPDKPYSVSLISGPNGSTLRIGLLDDHLKIPVTAGTRLRFGTQLSTVDKNPTATATIAWSQLAQPEASHAWSLRFITPTTFRRGNASTPSPSLRAILGSLRRAWRSFAPADLPPIAVELSDDPAWVTDINVASRVLHIDERIVSGFTGSIRFVCDRDNEVASAINRLVQLAPFAGVGAHTTYGLGAVELEATRPYTPGAPRPRRTPSTDRADVTPAA